MGQTNPAYNKYFLLGLIPFILFSLTIFSFSLNKPFNLDEADFANAAHGVLTKGIPVIDGAEPYSEKPKEATLALWHPPLYIYTLAAAFKLFGETTIGGRGLGLFFYVCTFAFLFLICKELFASKEFYIISFTAAALYLINPLLIQYSLLIDIDSGMLMLAIVAFSYFFIRFNKRQMGAREIFILGLFFALTLLIKFTTPPLIIGAIFLFYIFRRNYKKAFLYSFLIFLIGAVLAWLIWYFYCLSFKMPLFYPFTYTFASKWKQGNLLLTKEKMAIIKYSFFYSTCWVSPAFIALMVLCLFDRLRMLVRQRSTARIDFLLILAGLIYFFYFIYFPRLAMMKYQVPLYPLFIIGIAQFLCKVLVKREENRGREGIITLLLVLGVFAYYSLCFPDMVLWLQAGKLAVSEFFQNNYHLFKSLYFAPFFILPVILYLFYPKRGFFCSFVFSLLLLTATTQLSQNIKQTADYTTANSWYNYGEKGETQAIAYLNKKLPADGVAIARKDLGYYLKNYPRGSLERKWIYNSLFRLALPQANSQFKQLTEKYDIQYVQLDNTCNFVNGYEIIKPYFVFDRQFGGFFIFKKNK